MPRQIDLTIPEAPLNAEHQLNVSIEPGPMRIIQLAAAARLSRNRHLTPHEKHDYPESDIDKYLATRDIPIGTQRFGATLLGANELVSLLRDYSDQTDTDVFADSRGFDARVINGKKAAHYAELLGKPLERTIRDMFEVKPNTEDAVYPDSKGHKSSKVA